MKDNRLTLIPGRTLKQGTGMNIGKKSDEYQKAVTTIEMNREDMVQLGVEDGDTVRIRASGGEAVVQCRGADLPEGMAFIAYGPASSELMDGETHGSGMPDSKGFEVEVERVG
jgi:formylmethanofuran dehydrogenase subunit D